MGIGHIGDLLNETSDSQLFVMNNWLSIPPFTAGSLFTLHILSSTLRVVHVPVPVFWHTPALPLLLQVLAPVLLHVPDPLLRFSFL